MKKILYLWIGLILMGLFCGAAGAAQEKRVGEGVVLHATRAEIPPVIDGVLDDPAWAAGPIVTGPFIVNIPVYGEVLAQKTEVYFSYDSQNIYCAFYCHDDRPDQIKGTMTKRDAILNEDWVVFALDTMGSRQATYEHFANPLGIQADAIYSVSGGESFDPDWVWYSAGKIVANGYIVEMRIPLKSLKYQSGKAVTMNLYFQRYVSHTSANASWPQKNIKTGYFNSLTPVVFANLESQLRLEALPAVTFSSIRDHGATQDWLPTDYVWQAGLDLKYGVTSTSNLELTINPDFSQVESDQFQILANQRYPVFYMEKRPFFMEIANQFSLAGANGESNIWSAVYTRRIVEPAWGAKFSGEFDRFSIGVLASADKWPGRAWEGDSNPNLDKYATFMIGRLKYSLGGDNFVGALYSGREFAADYNRAMAMDGHFRVGGMHDFTFHGIYTFTQDAAANQKRDGGAFTAFYNYNQKPLDLNVMVEEFGRDFQMDSAIYPRIGISKLSGFIVPKFYPEWTGFNWIKRISLNVYGSYLHDKITGKDDTYASGTLSINTLWQGEFDITYSRKSEFWVSEHFPLNRLEIFASVQPLPWLNTHVSLSQGGGVYYDPQFPYLGERFDFHTCVFLQLGSQLRQHFSYTYENFQRADNGSQVYDLNILLSETTFQVNKYLFFRSLVQYDTYEKKILTDLLASFTLIPGTVLYLGYGSLHEKTQWQNGAWQHDLPGAQYQQMRQSVFCKASYRWQF